MEEYISQNLNHYKINSDVLNKTCLGTGHLSFLKFVQICGFLSLFSIPMFYTIIPELTIGAIFWVFIAFYLTFFSKRIKAIRYLNKALQDYKNSNYSNALYNIKQSFCFFPLGKDEKSTEILKDWENQLEYIIS